MFREELDKKYANKDHNFISPDEQKWRLEKQQREQLEAKQEQVSKHWATVAWDRIKTNVLKDFPRHDPETNRELPWVFRVQFNQDAFNTCPVRVRRQIQYAPIGRRGWIVIFDEEEATEIIRNGFFSSKVENYYVPQKAIEFFKELVQADGLLIEQATFCSCKFGDGSWWEVYNITYTPPKERK